MLCNVDDLSAAYATFVAPGIRLLAETGFPVSLDLSAAVLATGWAETRYRVRPFWATDALRGFPRYESVSRARAVLVMPTDRRDAALRVMLRFNDQLAAVFVGTLLGSHLEEQAITDPAERLNAARRQWWRDNRPPVTEDLWNVCAELVE